MRILVCDDDQDYAELIVSDLNKFFDNKFFDININIINNNFDLYLKEKCDICFMDIDLKNQSGISIVKNLKKNNKNMIIIFVSAREDLVFDTFSVYKKKSLYYGYERCDGTIGVEIKKSIHKNFN